MISIFYIKMEVFLLVRNSQQGVLYDVKHSLLKHSRTHPIFICLCVSVCAFVQLVLSKSSSTRWICRWSYNLLGRDFIFLAYFIFCSDFITASKTKDNIQICFILEYTFFHSWYRVLFNFPYLDIWHDFVEICLFCARLECDFSLKRENILFRFSSYWRKLFVISFVTHSIYKIQH